YPHAAGICAGGACSRGACDPNFDDCDTTPGNGCETDLQTTTAHCGSCATGCTNAHGTTSCAGGVCQPSCTGAFGDCDLDPKNGCETPTDTITNCGVCGRACTGDAGA